jgi:hypothetical protein
VKQLKDEADLGPQFGKVGGMVMQWRPVNVKLPFLELLQSMMQRMMVDLPDPLGPHTTTTSPGVTCRLTSLSTCSLPNHLLASMNRDSERIPRRLRRG